MKGTADVFGTVHVLVVEDDEKMRPLYTRFLFENTNLAADGFGLRFHWAKCGQDAIDLAARLVADGGDIGCAVVDFLMEKGCDGVDTILGIWEHDPRAQCTLVTAMRRLDEERTLDRIPAPFRFRWDFVAKPFTRLEITQRVRRSLAAWRAQRNEERHSAQNAELVQLLAGKNVKLEHTVTERTEDLARQNKRLERKNIQLQRAVRKLAMAQTLLVQQERMASIGQLAAGVAHELNNPIGFVHSNLGTLQRYCNKISTAMGALRDGRLDEGQTQRLWQEQQLDFVLHDLPALAKESLEGTERVRKIVQDLKLFSHAGEDKQDTDLNECVGTVLNIVRNEIKYKAAVETELAAIPMVRCVRGQINQVLLNLLMNAAQAIEDQGEIRVRTRCDDSTVTIEVSDTGSGMPEEVRARVFDPFFTTKPAGEGTGLGLSIACDIVRKHGGDMDVESEQGAGTTFRVSLPAEREVA